MRTRIATLTIVGLLAGVGGCASLPGNGTGVADYRHKLDSEVIAYVENHATREGARVFWVNPPRKKADQSSN